MWATPSTNQCALRPRGSTGRERADELAIRGALAQATRTPARRRRAVPRVRVDDVPAAAAPWPAQEAARGGSCARDARLHGAPGDLTEPGLELGHHLAADDGTRRVPVPLPRLDLADRAQPAGTGQACDVPAGDRERVVPRAQRVRRSVILVDSRATLDTP